MKKALRRSIVPAVVVVVLGFVVFALLRSAPGKSVPAAPDPGRTPVRIYGTIEPAGGAVYVAATVSRSIVSIAVREGDSVAAGQPLLRLESDVESAQLAAAIARADAAERSWAISRDAFRRNAELFSGSGISAVEFQESRLHAELDSATLAAARAEVNLARARLTQLTLSAPVTGIVYKLDVRLGQTMAAGDDSRIVLGPRRQQARLFAESFWLDRLRIGDRYRVKDSETGREFGFGRITSISPYVGGRTLRTEDTRERFDAGYGVVTLELENVANLPLGLSVVAEGEQQ